MPKTKEMFNNEIKIQFLKDGNYEEKTITNYKGVLLKTAPYEKTVRKDLYDFNIIEIESLLYSFDSLTPEACAKNAWIISSYINWAISKKLRKDKMNPLSAKPHEWFKKFVKEKKLYFTRDEIFKKVVEGCMNAQDAVIFALEFDGVSGNEGAEIRNLMEQDIDWDSNTLKVYDRKREDDNWRLVKVTADTMRLIRQALDKETYVKKNGEMEESKNVRDFTELVDNGYVLRNSITKTSNYSGAVDTQVFYRRVKTIKDSLGIDNLTSKNVERSGQIWMGMNLYEQYGVIGKDQLGEIAHQFNLKSWETAKSYVTIENIKKLYPNVKEVVAQTLH